MTDDRTREDGTYDAYDGTYDARQGGYGGTYRTGEGATGAEMDATPQHGWAADGLGADGFAPGEGVWHPLAPGGEFDAEATMNTPFAGHSPEPGAPGSGDPLAAPGHGYLPDGHDLPLPSHQPSGTPPPAGAAWTADAAGGFTGPQDDSGERWSVPFAPEDPAEASGEFSVGQLVAPSGDPAAAPSPAAPDGAAAAGPAFRPDPADPEQADALADPDPPPTDSPGGPDAPPDPAGEPAGPDDPAGDAPDDPADRTPETPDPHSEHPTSSYVLNVNGADRPVTDAWLGESLLYVLRERLGLAGAKDGCEQGECGACSVQVDGRLVASCLVPAATTAGSEVRTVEGLAEDGQPSDVQRALADHGAVQCGFCVPGLAMTVHDLLEGNHRPTELETRAALSGNLCRCTGYQGVLDAVREVSAARAAAHEAAGAVARDGHGEPPGGADGGPVAPVIPHQSTGDPDGATS